MRRAALVLITLAVAMMASLGIDARSARAQSAWDIVKQKAKQAALDMKRQADSAARASASGGAQSAVASAAGPAMIQSGAPATQLARTDVKVVEKVLITGEEGMRFEISPKGQHIAAIVLRGSRMAVVHDGVEGPKFDAIGALPGSNSAANSVAFSDDGSHFAYFGRIGQQWVVMADGKEVGRGAPYNQSTGVPTITLFGVGPKGKHVYFMTSTSEALATMYIDGKPGPAGGANLEAPVFSRDGERYAYLVISRPGVAQRATLIVDGKSGIPGGNPQFTADGKHLFTTNLAGGTVMEVYVDGKPFMRAPDIHLYMAPVGAGFLGVVNMPIQNNGRQNSFVTIANKKVPNSDCQQSVDRVYFSADGKHWAVRCRDAPTSYWAMADGKKGRDYYGVVEGIAFTADGRAVYQASNNGKSFMVVGEEELGPYQSLMPEGKAVPGVNTTPDDPPATISGNRVGFIVMTQRGNERIVVVDGKPTKTLLASALKFSSDGSRFAYISGNGARELVIDGVPNSGLGFPGNATLPNTYALSPDGKHVAQQSFSLSNVQKHGIAIDGKLILGEVGIGSLLTYTPDSKHLFWVSPRSGMARMHLFMDGQPIHEFGYTGGLLSTPDVWWSMGADGVLTFLGQDGDAMKRYTVTP